LYESFYWTLGKIPFKVSGKYEFWKFLKSSKN
jgi:hypothetical protein